MKDQGEEVYYRTDPRDRGDGIDLAIKWNTSLFFSLGDTGDDVRFVSRVGSSLLQSQDERWTEDAVLVDRGVVPDLDLVSSAGK